ncbi:SGNH/GDSL hydrolase family protein [Paenibacillus sp.]|uniref:SGNH/GDSL hydrolase family protein n=1 Tax=Paenibacillus sp. TaxID=58172 RepID=UPI002D2A80C9|nr:SGNH/GDSL hydrolase family protein [Paenibacillus sp.]HZG87932.1 SGNH/GDSL hydrolase family protein [Paenibacillus sp.]
MKPSWFRNCLGVADAGNGLLPMRFTDAQLEFFERRPHRFRCDNSAGICLDVRTDSAFLRMRYRAAIKPGTTEQLLFDVYVDDVLVGVAGDTVTDEGAGEWTIDLPIQPGKPRRVTVYFPYLASVTVEALVLAERASCEPAEPHPRNLLCFGDSITQGMNAVHPSQTYPVLLARQLRMNLLNQAISGFVFHPGMIDPALPYRPDLVTVAYGTNDWALCDSIERFEEQADGFIGTLSELYADVPIAVMSPLWRADLNDRKPCGPFFGIHERLERICGSQPNVQYIDGLALTPHHERFYADGLHPNDQGFFHMTLSLLRRLTLAE